MIELLLVSTKTYPSMFLALISLFDKKTRIIQKRSLKEK